MKKTMIIVALATLAAFSLSCSRKFEAPENDTIENDASEQITTADGLVYLTIALDPETKVSYEYVDHANDGTNKAIKPQWDDSDALTVSFTVGGSPVEETFSIDPSSISVDKMTARFYRDGSQIGSKDGNFNVSYAGNATAAALKTQDGTLEHLPTYLEASDVTNLDSPITLQSKLTYLHFELTAAEEHTFTHAYLRQTAGDAMLLGTSTDDVVKVAFGSSTAINSTTKHVYLATNLDESSTNSSKLQLVLMNADYNLDDENYFTGVENGLVEWNVSKDYLPGAVYRKAAAISYTSNVVGTVDTAWWTVWTSSYPVAPGKVLQMDFINTSNGVENYQNWNLVISNAALGDASYKEYFVLRSDDWGWANQSPLYLDFNDPEIDLTMNGSSTIDWDAFRTAMNGAKVKIIVEHTSAGSVFITATAQKGADVIVEKYSQAVSASQDIVAFLACDHSSFNIQGISYSTSTKTVESLETSPCFVYNEDLPLATIFADGGIQNQLVATYDNGAKANVDPSLLTSYGGSEIDADGPNSQTFSVTFAGNTKNLTIPVIGGTGSLGAKSLEGYSFVTNESLSSGSSIEAYMYLYAHNASWGKDTFTTWEGPRIRLMDGSINVAARLDNWIDDGGADQEAQDAFSTRQSNWNWDILRNYINRAKVTLKAENVGDGTANVRFAIQYACDNMEAGKGSHYQNYTGISVNKDALTTEWNIYNSYGIFVNAATAEANDWPTVTVVTEQSFNPHISKGDLKV